MRFLLAACAAFAACSGNMPNGSAPVAWNRDSELAPVLTAPELGRAQMTKVDTLASLMVDFDDRLANVVLDTTNPALVRTNAILLLADRRAGGQVQAFLSALEARQESVRAAAVLGLRNYLTTWTSTVDLLKLALQDPSPLVQARALETLADNEPGLLREYLDGTPSRELRGIAQDLLLAAESRGAAMVPVDSIGTLRRTGAESAVLTFRPVKKWQDWSASLGTLTLTVGDATPVTLSDSVEVVENVLPAFFSADGGHVVYESNRHIYVRDVNAETTRLVGRGIAPRVLPFSESFVFAHERERIDNPQGASISYEVLQAGFASGTPVSVGVAGTHARNDVAGNYSPLRWARIREKDGLFVLTGDALADVRLPDPFASSSTR